MSPKSQPGFLSIFTSLFPSLPNLLPSKDLELTTRDLLIPSTGDPMTIIHNADIVLLPYANHPAIITGNISTCTNTITLDNPQNLTQTE